MPWSDSATGSASLAPGSSSRDASSALQPHTAGSWAVASEQPSRGRLVSLAAAGAADVKDAAAGVENAAAGAAVVAEDDGSGDPDASCGGHLCRLYGVQSRPDLHSDDHGRRCLQSPHAVIVRSVPCRSNYAWRSVRWTRPCTRRRRIPLVGLFRGPSQSSYSPRDPLR